MRLKIGSLFVAILVAWAFNLSLVAIGHTQFRLFASYVSILVAISLYLGITMAHEATHIPEFVKQIAVWLSIATLLPLVVWYGTDTISGSPDNDAFSKSQRALQERMGDAKDDVQERQELRKERDKLEDAHKKAMREFARNMFWVAYPLGMAAFVIGTLIRVQAVGSGLMFGGISTLVTGCFSYWDQMDSWLKFVALLVALGTVTALGLLRFRDRSNA